MDPRAFDDETLMAYADGQLDEETSALVDEAIARDPDLAARVVALAEAGAAVRDLHAPLKDLPVPPELEARIRAMAERAGSVAPAADNVVSFGARREQRRTGGGFWPMAMAASIAAVIAGPLGYLAAGPGAPVGASAPGLAMGAPVSAALASLLDTVPSGETRPAGTLGALELVASFRDPDGQLCREFEVKSGTALVGVACREDADWHVTFAVEASLTGGYAPAGAMAALDAYLTAASAGEPLTIEEEAKALAGL